MTMDPDQIAARMRQEALQGLRTVAVAIDVSPHAEELGLTTESIRALSHAKLEEAGIEVVGKKALLQGEVVPPAFSVTLTVVASELSPGVASYAIRVELSEGVHVERDHSIVTVATTWHIASSGAVEILRSRSLARVVEQRIDQFIDDYRAANP